MAGMRTGQLSCVLGTQLDVASSCSPAAVSGCGKGLSLSPLPTGAYLDSTYG